MSDIWWNEMKILLEGLNYRLIIGLIDEDI